MKKLLRKVVAVSQVVKSQHILSLQVGWLVASMSQIFIWRWQGFGLKRVKIITVVIHLLQPLSEVKVLMMRTPFQRWHLLFYNGLWHFTLGANVSYASEMGEIETNVEIFQMQEGCMPRRCLFFCQILDQPHVQKCKKWKYLFRTYIALLLLLHSYILFGLA